MKYVALCAMALAVLSGCEVGAPNADQMDARYTKQQAAEGHKQVGDPDIVNFTEKRLARDILELRDQEKLATFTYIVNLNGDLIFLGHSIGYGLPYSVQFTNPEREVYGGGHNSGFGTLPQPDPNLLFMPGGLSATWILLKDPTDPEGEAHPVYVEQELLVSPFKLH